MRLFITLIFTFWSFLSLISAQLIQPRLVYQFSNGTWIENIAVRSNGKLLVTLVDVPELWEIDPFTSHENATARLVHRFGDAVMCNGISELEEDVFAVIASNVVWKVSYGQGAESANVREIVNITEAGVLNGMTTLDADEGIVLIADSRLGLVWRLDTRSASYEVVLQDQTMTARSGRRSLIGINGIKVLGDYVYYNNCPGRLFCRVEICPKTARATGDYEVIAEGNLVLADDFAITDDGVAYLAGLDDNVVARVLRNGTVDVVAGSTNSSILLGATAAAFGRTELDQNVLYVTTGGGTAAPLDGYTEGGKVMALDTDRWSL